VLEGIERKTVCLVQLNCDTFRVSDHSQLLFFEASSLKMDLVDIEKRAFLFALKAIYFDQGGAWSSALDYYVAAGESLLRAAESGSRIPDLQNKALLYCQRSEAIQRTLEEEARARREEEADEDDWDRLDDAVSVGVEARELTGRDEGASSVVDDVLLNDYVVIYNSAVDGKSVCHDDEDDNDDDGNKIMSVADAQQMARLTRRLFASALEADAAGNVEDAFLLYMRAVDGTIADQRREAKRLGVTKTAEEKEVDKKMRVLAANAIERIEAVKEELTRWRADTDGGVTRR